MTYSESQLLISDTLAASDTAAIVQCFWETCLKQKPPDESKNALSEPTTRLNKYYYVKCRGSEV